MVLMDFYRCWVGLRCIGTFRTLLIHFDTLVENLHSEAWEAFHASQAWFYQIFISFNRFKTVSSPFDTFRSPNGKLTF